MTTYESEGDGVGLSAAIDDLRLLTFLIGRGCLHGRDASQNRQSNSREEHGNSGWDKQSVSWEIERVSIASFYMGNVECFKLVEK